MHIKCLENPNSETVDVVIATVPWTDSTIPLMAPAVLKPIVTKANLTSHCVDLNAEVYSLTLDHPEKFKLIKFFFEGVGDESINEWLEDLLLSIAKGILSRKPKYVGLSLFSYASRQSCHWLSYYIKKLSPDTKIIIGGAGCLEQFSGPSTFADDMISAGFVDYHIRGDGEKALYELLTGNDQYPGINSVTWQELTRTDLEQLPIPDYSDYDFSYNEHQTLGIQGSRGCVRSCTFCDFITNWTKFHWRTGQSIFDEMLEQYKRYGIRSFKFQDTLVNGNQKEFNNLIELIADYNTQNPDKKFSWGGFYIFREQSSNDDWLWQTLARSGASALNVGIESLSQDIRYHMGKKFSNDSIDYHLEQAYKHNINLVLLFIVGYVTETQSHIDFSKQWLDAHTKYKDLIMIQWGGSLGIFPNTYLDKNKEQLGIKIIGDQPNLWISQNIDSNPSMRAKWVQELTSHSKKLGYKVFENIDNHFILEQLLHAHI